MLNAIIYDLQAGLESNTTAEATEGEEGESSQDICLLCCAYSWLDDRFYVFEGNNLAVFARLARTHDVTFGFSSHTTDRVLEAQGYRVCTTYDLEQEARTAARYQRHKKLEPDSPPVDFDALCLVNLGYSRPEPVLRTQTLQQARLRALHTVRLLKTLIENSGLLDGAEGRLLDPNTGKWLHLRPLFVPEGAYRSLDADKFDQLYTTEGSGA